MEGETFSIIGICTLLVGIIISVVQNVKYNGEHNPSETGYKLNNSTENALGVASVITLSAGYILSLIGFGMNNDSLHYTAKPRHHQSHLSTSTAHPHV